MAQWFEALLYFYKRFSLLEGKYKELGEEILRKTSTKKGNSILNEGKQCPTPLPTHSEVF